MEQFWNPFSFLQHYKDLGTLTDFNDNVVEAEKPMNPISSKYNPHKPELWLTGVGLFAGACMQL